MIWGYDLLLLIGVSLSEPQCNHVYGGKYCCGLTTTDRQPTSQVRVMTSTGISGMGGAQPVTGSPLASYGAINGQGYTSTPCAHQ